MTGLDVLWLACFLLTLGASMAARLLPAYEISIKRTIWIPAFLTVVIVLGSGDIPLDNKVATCAAVLWALWMTFQIRDQATLDARIDGGIARFLELRAKLRNTALRNTVKPNK
jgi:hypothetical protein